jgi:hypothetical protein
MNFANVGSMEAPDLGRAKAVVIACARRVKCECCNPVPAIAKYSNILEMSFDAKSLVLCVDEDDTEELGGDKTLTA